jgi:hypothetical protein
MLPAFEYHTACSPASSTTISGITPTITIFSDIRNILECEFREMPAQMRRPAGFKNHSTTAPVQQDSSAGFCAGDANADAAKVGLLMYTVF